MEKISEEKFNNEFDGIVDEEDNFKITDKNFKKMMVQMENPIEAQKEIAIKIKIFLDAKMSREMEELNALTDSTRRWIETYNNLLEKIQKSIYGDKSVNLHIHKISHSDIATKIREIDLK